jgi:hypothetical protein
MPLRVYIDPGFSFRNILMYVFRLIAGNKRFECSFVNEVSDAEIKILAGSDSDFSVSKLFYQKLSEGKFAYQHHFNGECMIRDEDGREDLLSTIFYCVNSIQEYNVDSDDELGRFAFKYSYQSKFGIAKENLVQKIVDRVCEHPSLKQKAPARRKSKVFLTHDIDSIHGAWKEDGFYALKKLKFGTVFNLLLNETLQKPDWLNIDRIMKIENEYGFHSVFYWLLYNDKGNSDYNFSAKNVQQQVQQVEKNGWENGLHKSLGSRSFQDELNKFGREANGNRYHYLNFKLPGGYAEIEQSKLKLDTTLGYYDEWGFRNSYGLPFMPYSLKDDRVFNFVEVPMHIMDRTFFTRRDSVSDIKKNLTEWMEKNLYDCVLTINFHNNFFSELKYTGYTELYKFLLSYLKDNAIEPVSEKELINEYYLPEKFIGIK